MEADPERRREYLDAWADWQRQLSALHRVLLDGEPLPPPNLKGLLNREARAKARYDRARLSLLGLEPAEGDAPTGAAC